MSDAAEARRLARYSEGSLQRALELTDAELWSFRKALLEQLSERLLPSVSLAQTVAKFIEEAGKDASARRMRFRQVVGFAVEFLSWNSCTPKAAVSVSEDQELREQVQRAVGNGHSDSELSAKTS